MNNIFRKFIEISFVVVGVIFLFLGVILDFNLVLIIFGIGFIWMTRSFKKTNKKTLEQEKENKLKRVMETYVAGSTYNQDVIEEMYWNDNLPATLTATLEDDVMNEYNKNAVKVIIQDKEVGFLADKELPKYREYQKKYSYVGTSAYIVQGGELNKDGEIPYFIDLKIAFEKNN